jgi:plasmid stabilization system protein ParE
MNSPFQLTTQATEDLDAIWRFIAEDNREAADRVETLAKFPNYAIVYRPETVPLQVVAVLHGKRDPREVLEGRS